MATRKPKTTKKETPDEVRNSRLPRPSRLSPARLKNFLSVVFYLIWIPIGLFLLFFIVMSFRQGAFNNVLGKAPATNTAQTPEQPTETQIPGVGTVNIACVQQNLSQDAIQKIITVGDTSTFTADEKAKLEPCITQKETPAATPDNATTGQ